MKRTVLAAAYLLIAALILCFGIVNICYAQGKLWINIIIILIGVYYLYRFIATVVNGILARKREKTDMGNDPANA